jgi:hypothetical protein
MEEAFHKSKAPMEMNSNDSRKHSNGSNQQNTSNLASLEHFD